MLRRQLASRSSKGVIEAPTEFADRTICRYITACPHGLKRRADARGGWWTDLSEMDACCLLVLASPPASILESQVKPGRDVGRSGQTATVCQRAL